MRAIYVYTPGGPEAMKIVDVPELRPSDHEAVVEHKAIGVNFIDVYFRKGIYPVPLPIKLGYEAAGVVVGIGRRVKDFKIGDRVAYTSILGSYAQRNVIPADRLIKLPKKISFQQAAAVTLQGITAHYLTHSTYPLKKNQTCLIHAAAGGVGLLLCQVAKLLGAEVIGTVSSEAKGALAKKAGADYVINYARQDFVSEVKRITGGKGVSVVYDGVGLATFEKSLDCLMPRGMMVLFGQSSGTVPPFDLGDLNRKGSLYVTRCGINAYTVSREELLWRANTVFKWIMRDQLKLTISQEFPLAQVAQAHSALENRQTTGKILLIP